MSDVVNLQRKVPLDLAAIRVFVTSILEMVAEAEGGNIAVAFVSDRRMRILNDTFRGKNAPTDVLSFPHEPDALSSLHSPLTNAFLGDIVVSAETAQRQSAENGLDVETEIKQLILHGLLHLCGYDHETDKGEMDARELELRRTLGI